MASLYLIEVSNSHPSRRRKPSPWCPRPCRYRASGGGFARLFGGLALALGEPGSGAGDLCGVIADGFRLVTVGYGAGDPCPRCRQPSIPVPGRIAPVPGRAALVPGRIAPVPGRIAPVSGHTAPVPGQTVRAPGRT